MSRHLTLRHVAPIEIVVMAQHRGGLRQVGLSLHFARMLSVLITLLAVVAAVDGLLLKVWPWISPACWAVDLAYIWQAVCSPWQLEVLYVWA